MWKHTTGASKLHFCYLNELQCNFVVTLSRNTEEVVDFKLSLVIAFDQAKKEVALLQEVINESVDVLEKKRLYYQKRRTAEKHGGTRRVRSHLEQTGRKVLSTLNFLPENRHLHQIPKKKDG